MLAHVVLGIGLWLLAGQPIATAQADKPTTPAAQARPIPSQAPEIRPNPNPPNGQNKAHKGGDQGPMSPVPEPATLAVVGAGLVLIAFLLRRRNRELGVEPNA